MTTTLDDKETLTQQAREVNKRLEAIRDAERFNEGKALVGKCFRYRNSFSYPEKSSDYWWLYAKVQKVSKAGYLTVFFFETNKYGTVTIRTDIYKPHMLDGYRPISAAEFSKAWRNLKRRVNDIQP